MTIKECYLRLDGDYDDIMERLGTEKLVERFMLKFPQEGERQMAALHEAMENEDIEECFKVAHSLSRPSCTNNRSSRIWETSLGFPMQDISPSSNVMTCFLATGSSM